MCCTMQFQNLAALDAFEAMYGKRALPNYHFDTAKAIVSVGADFLGDWQGVDLIKAMLQAENLKQVKCLTYSV